MPFTSGTYTGTSQNAYRLILRVDVGDRSDLPLIPGNAGMFSGDVFAPSGFLFSFKAISGSFNLAGSITANVQIEYALPATQHYLGTFTGTLLNAIGGIERINVVLQNDALFPPIVIEAQKSSQYLRTASLEVDLVQRPGGTVTRAPAEFSSNTVNISVKKAMQLAGIDLVELNPVRDIIAANTVPVEWNEQSLANVMLNSQTWTASPSWRLYLLVATSFRSSSSGSLTRGIMIQTNQIPSRKGAALFYDGCVQSSTPANFERDYIRTAVHEMGHVFNLLHTFDPLKGTAARVTSTSFMNYPDYFPGNANANATAYWNSFRWTFDPDELGVLRHGTLDRVIMGGSRFASSLIDDVGHRMDTAGDPVGGLKLTLRVSPDGHGPLFEFGEPIVVEARLTNVSPDAVDASDTLSPSHRQTEYIVQKPSGQYFRHSPIVQRCSGPRTQTLSPMSPRAVDCSLYESVQLSCDAKGFRMIDPGRYTIQAVHYSDSGLLYSNILSVHVRVPPRRVEGMIAPLFEPALAGYLGLWGAPPLSSAADALCGDLLQRKTVAMHPLVAEYARCRFNLESVGFHAIDQEGSRLQFIQRGPDRSVVSAVQKALGLPDQKTRRRRDSKADPPAKTGSCFSNIIYAHSARQLLDYTRGTESTDDVTAGVVRKTAIQRLVRRGVPAELAEDVIGNE